MNRNKTIILGLSFPILLFSYCNIYAQSQNQPIVSAGDGGEGIVLSDPKLKLELVASGLDFPTTMAFLGPNDFLILEKDTGLVKRVIDGKTVEKPLLQIEVSKKDERGLLGIAISEIKTPDHVDGTPMNNNDITHYVFLYAVQCDGKGKSQNCENRIYRYDLDSKNNVLINPKLLLAIPSFPESSHVGGIVKVGPDGNLYLTVGNFQRTVPTEFYASKSQNYEEGHDFDGRGGILRLTQDGQPVNESILGSEYPLNLYYAYGIRNSFGMDFDPLTGKLWDSENGPYFADEINLVQPGFNSGAEKIFGIWHSDGKGNKLKLDESSKTYDVVKADKPSDLLYVGKGYYGSPKFIWDKTVAPTALVFYQSNSLGNQYENDIFVGSVDGGRIFNFNLNDQRDDLVLEGPLSDRIANDKTEYQDITFADGFSYITDLKIEPGTGDMYVVSGSKATTEKGTTEKFGAVYRIVPTEGNMMQENVGQQVDQAQQVDIGVSVLDALTKMAPKAAEKPKIDAKSIGDLITKPYKVSSQPNTDGENETIISTDDVKNNIDTPKMNFDQTSKIVNESELG